MYMICYVFLSNIVACQEEEGTVPNKRKKYGQSAVWKYFDKSADGRTAECIKRCKTYQTSGNTTNLSCHLKANNPTLTISERRTPSTLSFIDKIYETSSNRKHILDSALCY